MRSAACALSFTFLVSVAPAALAAEPKKPSTGRADVAAAGPAPKRCQRLPSGKRILKLELKPDSEVRDIIGWMTTISCTEFVTTGVDLEGKRVTIPSSGKPMSLEEAYALFTAALGDVGLTVEPGFAEGRKSLRILPKPAP